MSHLAALSVGSNATNPTRDQIINVKANFCNVFDSEGIPIFDGFIDYLIINDSVKANDWVVKLKAANTTHITLDLSGNYLENLGWTPLYPIPGMDWSNDLSGFSNIIDWVQNRGFIPIIKLAFDGQGAGPGWNDPIGWTYGWQWGMDNMERIANGLSKHIKKVLWSTGWDGCFPTWTRNQTILMLQHMRKILGPEACIDTEFNGPGSVGYTHMGLGAGDWTPETLGILDNFSIEATFSPDVNGIQQVAARLLGSQAKNIEPPNYYAGKPPSDDNCFLTQMINLGKKINMCWFEQNAYLFIRKLINENQARDASTTVANYGFTSFGNGQPF